ncbi:pyridoxamine 5'-phosphate oxidase, FMN-binding protein [Citreicella sp. 357]|nr:pyridoxamine 5'-phosphate oxidase, FMN-binding protein [Citreicella sp. 357]
MGHTFDPQQLLSMPLMANLATMCAEGPRNAPVWFIWEDDAIWMLGDRDGSSVRRLEEDPRCAVEIVRFDRGKGILLHLGMRGTATVEPMRPELFGRLLEKYLGADRSKWNSWFIGNIARIDDPSGRLIRLEPQSFYTNNVSYFWTGPDLAWSPGMPLS